MKLAGYELKSGIKVYRVRHDIAPPDLYGKLDPPLSANDPILYRPFYMGWYSPDGTLEDEQRYSAGGILQEGDPFLDWLLPIVRMDDTTGITEGLRARLHAGEGK